MMLEMDFGNSRIKWRLRNQQEILLRGAVANQNGLNEVSENLQEFKDKIKSIWIACVLGESARDVIFAWAIKFFNIKPIFAQSKAQAAGVTNGYREPEKLGVDRWLAILAARQYSESSTLVVSCGTAMTVDLLSKTGCHLGGYITPGWTTALMSLNQSTKLIGLQGVVESGLRPGCYTQQAVDHGLTAAYVGLVENAITQLKTQTGDSSLVMLATGGDAKYLSDYFPDLILREDLVLDGLAYCLN